MTYINQWFGALTGSAFLYGCMLGMMAPPRLHPQRVSLVDAHVLPDEREVAAPIRLADHRKPRVPHPAPAPEAAAPQALKLAA